MKAASRWFGMLCVATVVSACGGGDSGEEDKDCSDFAFQEDAQAWHNAYPSALLDADRDGIACEALPRRSGGSGGGAGAGSALTLPSLMVFDLGGSVASVTKGSSNYSLRSMRLDGMLSGTMTAVSFGDGRVALDSPSAREYVLDVGGPEGWPARSFPEGDAAYAWPMSSVSGSLAPALGGVYNFMGRRCVARGGCSVTAGQFSVDVASRTVLVCIGGTLTGCGTTIERFDFESSLSVPDLPGVYRLRSPDGTRPAFIAFGTSTQGAVGISMSVAAEATATVSAFAARTSMTFRLADTPTAQFRSIGTNGSSARVTAAALGIGAIVDSPMVGFFRLAGNDSALAMVAIAPARVLLYDGSTYTLWLN